MEKAITNSREYLGKNVDIVVDRPLGTKHPKWGFVYESNYGYIPGTLSPDGEELDAYLLGLNEAVESGSGKVIAIIHRTNDDDDKLIVSIDGSNIEDKSIRTQTDFQEKFFKSEIIR